MSKKLLMNVNDSSLTDSFRKYYQEMTGSFITASDISASNTLDTERFIEIIEIFGNTIQDSTDLSKIESLGVWNESKKGYEIDILSTNANLLSVIDNTFLPNIPSTLHASITDKSIHLTGTGHVKSKNIKLPQGEFNLMTESTLIEGYLLVRAYNSGGTQIGSLVANKLSFTVPTDGMVSFGFWCTTSQSNGDVLYDNLRIVKSIEDNYIPHQQHKTTILLPCQLQKVGNVADRLYWDSVKGRYVVEKKVVTYTIDALGKVGGTSFYLPNAPSPKLNTPSFIVDKDEGLITSTHTNGSNKNIYINYNVDVAIELGLTDDYLKIRQYIIDNKYMLIYSLNTPTIIETNITEKIKVPTFANKTHILTSSTNGIDCSNSKVLVPYKELT